jgi:hypothetical protein
MTDRPIIWQPTERQSKFLEASEDEVLYGGAAGGGKSDALVIDALGLHVQAIMKPEYRALILRRTFVDLKEIIDRSRALYPQIVRGATYNNQGAFWQFPSGARIELGHLDSDDDRNRYQSRQFQWLGWEELAQWPTEALYTYMMTRLRKPERLDIPLSIRATCNPDGIGARWIAKRWKIQPSGESTGFEVITPGSDRIWHRRFISARLEDNPHINTEYRDNLMMQDDQTRRALLDGRWDEPQVGGGIYTEVLNKAREDKRITRVPIAGDLPVDTAWDLGVGDATSIWFYQSAGKEIWLVDYYEASGEGFPHYKSVLDKRGYNYGRHIAPHDIRVREMGSGQSRIDVARKLGIRFEIAPSIGLEDGIHAVRMMFPKFWIDETRCAVGLEHLSRYRRKFNRSMGEYTATPEHDSSSHCADSLRYLCVSHKLAQPKPTFTASRPRSTSSDGMGWLGV